MADNLFELGLEVASISPDDKNEKRYIFKILQTIGIIIIFPLIGFLLFEIDFSNIIHNIILSILFFVFISFIISYRAEDGKIRNYLLKYGMSRISGFLAFVIIFLVISILIFNTIL